MDKLKEDPPNTKMINKLAKLDLYKDALSELNRIIKSTRNTYEKSFR